MSNLVDEIMVPPETKRAKHCEGEIEENNDRLSDLPDCVLLRILSFVETKYVVRTSILSRRWKDLWKRLPSLIFQCTCYPKIFTKFMYMVLSLRDGSIPLLAFDFNRRGSIEPHVLKRTVKYAISHNVQRLGITVSCDMKHVPPAIFSSQTLTSLRLSFPKGYTLFPNALSLPALTSLHLQHFTFCAGDNDQAEPFSACIKLNALTLDCCYVSDTDTLCVSSTTLVNFALHSLFSKEFFKIVLSTPNLSTFDFTGLPYQQLCVRNVPSVERVNIDGQSWSTTMETPPWVLLNWLLELANIKSLTVSSRTLQVLYLYPDLLKLKLPCLHNLKSLKVIVKPLPFTFSMELTQLRGASATPRKGRKAKSKSSPVADIPDGIVDFLLQNSPSAKVEIINPSK